MTSNILKKWRTFIDLVPNMVYNGIVYEIKRLAGRNLLAFITGKRKTKNGISEVGVVMA